MNASGYVVARRRATVSSKVTGKVVDVLIEEGQPVKAGQILAHLDDTQPRASLALAEAQLASSRKSAAEDQARLQQAELTLGRRQQLLKEGVVGKAELDDAQANVDALKARIAYAQQQVLVAESQVNLQKTNLTDMVVRAPFGGVVISKDAQPGEMISPVSAGGGFTRTGIGTIVDMSSLEVEVDVNETYINRVVNGMRVEAVLDAYQDWKIPGHVITTIPSADRQKATVKVRIGFDGLDPRILPDMGVKVSFLREAPSASQAASAAPRVIVPKPAIRTVDGKTIVFVVKDDRVERRAVSVGLEQGDQVEVLSGVSAGERVVVEGPPTLKDGDKGQKCSNPGERAAASQPRGRSGAWGRSEHACRRRGEAPVKKGAMMSSSLVTVRDLHKVFKRGGERIDVLQGVNLDIPQGDFLALMGPSGSGKTTLLNLIGGLDTPTEGAIDVAGDRIDKMSGGKLSAWRARHIGFVFQLYNLLPVLTAARNVELPLLLTKLGKSDRRKRVEVALSAVGLGDRMQHFPRQLSGGQEQRVGIARAIVTDPTLLLCDEPTGDLDRKAGDEILDLLQALNRDHGKTIVMVTHDPHAAVRAKRTLFLDKGVLVTEAVA